MSSTYSFDADAGDIQEMKNAKILFGEFCSESKKLWYLAAPAICNLVSQHSINAVTQIFAGHVGDIQLAAVAVQISLISGFAFSILYGMGSALQTLCGQAFGAKRPEMLGIYMQRSWVILLATGIPLTTLYIFSTPILNLLHQNPRISKAAGTFALWMIPQLFVYIICIPTQKFLTAQSKIYVLATISAVALVGHVLFSWLFMLKLRWGLPGGAAALNATWWFVTVVQLVYVFSGACGKTWNGFSWEAFGNLKGYLRLSLASGVMLCVRVSNELGGGHPRRAKFCVVVATTTSLFIGIILGLIPIALRSRYPPLFSKSSSVQKLVYDLTPLLGITIILNSIQPTLSGVAIGAGWQSYVAYVNIVCYYLVGIPIGLVLGFVFNKGVKGIWYGMLTGTAVQTIVLIVMVLRTNWNKEALLAGERIKKWGGDSSDSHPVQSTS
nr:protein DETOXIFICATION 29-like [Ipomoea batatas]